MYTILIVSFLLFTVGMGLMGLVFLSYLKETLDRGDTIKEGLEAADRSEAERQEAFSLTNERNR